MITAAGEPTIKLCTSQKLVPIIINCLNLLSLLLKEANVCNVEPVKLKRLIGPTNVDIITRKEQIIKKSIRC